MCVFVCLYVCECHRLQRQRQSQCPGAQVPAVSHVTGCSEQNSSLLQEEYVHLQLSCFCPCSQGFNQVVHLWLFKWASFFSVG